MLYSDKTNFVFKIYIAIFLIIISLVFSLSHFKVLASSNLTRGAAVLTDIDSLPYIKTGTTVHEISSYDRTGGNNDGSGYYLYQNPKTGGYVVLEENHPGAIFRIWETADNIEGRIKIYFDGEERARVDEDQQEFFSGKKVPFLSPLVGNPEVSSGGYYSYYPFAFAKSIRIEYTVLPKYYQITYHLYDDSTGVATYTGQEDLSKVYSAWNNPWQDPKSRDGNQTLTVSNINIPAGQNKIIGELSGAGSVRSIKLTLSQLSTLRTLAEVPNNGMVTDEGKAFKGSSSFTVKIDPKNVGVVLKRRFDYTIANQIASVFVDGEYIDSWVNPGSEQERWRDSEFSIPFKYTSGKDKINVKIAFAGSAIDWNEFHYWIKSSLPTGPIETDEVDVGNAFSETNHNYSIDNLTWSGSRAYTYWSGSQVIPTPNPTSFPSSTPTPTPNVGDSSITDEGKAFKGSSSFTVKIDPANNGVTLTRRTDMWIGNQKADVYVDGVLAGSWLTSGIDQIYRWRDADFSIPAAFTQGKNQVNLKIQFVSSDIDWNEFYYWIKSNSASGQLITDEIDVGKTGSESLHNYSIDNLTWSGIRTLIYPPKQAPGTPSPTPSPTPTPTPTPIQVDTIRDILSNARIKIYWDDETIPSVDMPLGFFFGVGSSGEALVKGLLIGVDPIKHTYYNFFPMPYGKHAKIVLENNSSLDIVGANIEIQYNSSPYNGLGANAGYFKGIYNKQDPTVSGQDYQLINLTGKGHIVGTVLNISQMIKTLEILEGDHQIFIDSDTNTPTLQGTGTEDFFNGGYFFRKGTFTLPLQGNPIKDPNSKNTIVMYRLNPYDAFTFDNKITFKFEHGYSNDLNAKYESGVFAYLATVPTLTPTPIPTKMPTPTPRPTPKPTPVPQPPKHIITGQVIGIFMGRRIPVLFMEVTAQNIKTKQIYKTKTGFNGTYSFNLPDDNYLVKPNTSKLGVFSPSEARIELSGKNIANVIFKLTVKF